MSILEVKNLNISFSTLFGEVKAVKNVSFEVKDREILGIVGESGSGKSVTNLGIMGLLDKTNSKVTGESVKLLDKEILNLKEIEMCKIRGRDISMIFQEPMTSLNPVVTVYNQLREVYKLHDKSKYKNCREHLKELLEKLHVPEADKVLDKYPFELSGGLKQRIMIAMAMVCEPKLLICDEPTTALDVTTQAEILSLIEEIKEKENMSAIFITHDLGVVSQLADRVIVMYFGEIVEECKVEDFFKNPLHPYSIDLLNTMPENFNGRFATIKGQIPRATEVIEGCAYYNRCNYACDKCKEKTVELEVINENRKVRCVRTLEIGGDNSVKGK